MTVILHIPTTRKGVRQGIAVDVLQLPSHRITSYNVCYTKLLRTSGSKHRRRMLLLEGCVQPALAPQINHATRQVLDKLGISAVSHHLGAVDEARDFMRRNISYNFV